jgi:hypothetical protein
VTNSNCQGGASTECLRYDTRYAGRSIRSSVFAGRTGRVDLSGTNDMTEVVAGEVYQDAFWRARMLLARANPGDPELAQDLLRQALATARDRGLTNIERRTVQLLTR